jgi:hypothetical protein
LGFTFIGFRPFTFSQVLTAVIARSASDEASSRSPPAGLLRFARNDSGKLLGIALVIAVIAQDNGAMTAQTATEFP